MLASFLKRDRNNLIQRDASPNFQAQNGLLSLRSWWRSVRSLEIPTWQRVAPAGSYRSGGGGNETVEAFETTPRSDGVASPRRVTSVNAERAPTVPTVGDD